MQNEVCAPLWTASDLFNLGPAVGCTGWGACVQAPACTLHGYILLGGSPSGGLHADPWALPSCVGQLFLGCYANLFTGCQLGSPDLHKSC